MNFQKFPVCWEQLRNFGSGVLCNALQDVAEILKRVDLREAAGYDEGIDYCRSLGTDLAGTAEPVFLSQRYVTNLAFYSVGIDGEFRVCAFAQLRHQFLVNLGTSQS